MCGIAGAWNPKKAPSELTLRRMADALTHRGPDDAGTWADPEAGIGLAHRRLSILDLSAAGHQPMSSASARFVLVYNGEIYNFAALREELERSNEPLQWRGHSDTEILLAGFERWGVRETLVRANGMFAIAVFDRQERVLTLARDRMGEKPLYFGWVGSSFCFASELKSFAVLDQWQPQIEADVAAQFLRNQYVGGPRSLVTGLFRLPPGTLLTLRRQDIGTRRDWTWIETRLTKYWSLADAARAGRPAASISAPEARERFAALLQDAVALRMVADVPVGAFLSGGVDSSAVVALMQKVATHPVRTFSIGFSEKAFDESPYAAAVARHLHTEHTEAIVTPQDALDLIPQLPDLYDEPFADSSQIPTVLLARMAGQHIKVVQSGDAGDELFGGYARYARILRLWRFTQSVPAALRPTLAWGARGAAFAARPFDSGAEGKSSAFKLSRWAERLEAKNIDEMRHRFMAAMPATGLRMQTNDMESALHCKAPAWMDDPLDRVMYADQLDYLPDDILVKVDRAAMACSLETRVPLLDHRIVEFAWSLPRELVRGPGGTKLPLRRLLYEHVPRALIERPKKGFSIPLAVWLRGPLKPWAESLMAQTNQQAAGLWDARHLATSWQAHQSGKKDLSRSLWNILMLSAWLQRTGARI